MLRSLTAGQETSYALFNGAEEALHWSAVRVNFRCLMMSRVLLDRREQGGEEAGGLGEKS